MKKRLINRIIEQENRIGNLEANLKALEGVQLIAVEEVNRQARIYVDKIFTQMTQEKK